MNKILKQIQKYMYRRAELCRIAARLESNIVKETQVRDELIKKEALDWNDNAPVEQSKRIKRSHDVLFKLKREKKDTLDKIKAIEGASQKDATEYYGGVQGILSKTCNEKVALCEQINKEIGTLRQQILLKEKELAEAKVAQSRAFGMRGAFNRHWTPEKLLLCIEHSAEFLREPREIIEAIGVYDEWSEAKEKKHRQSQKQALKSQKDREQEFAKDRGYKKMAMDIIQGRRDMPKELSATHNRLSLPWNVLVEFLRRRDEKKKVS